MDQKRRIVVGVNDYVDQDGEELEILQVSEEAGTFQRKRLARLREGRDAARVESALQELRSAAARDDNVIPYMLDCARAYCTLFEIRHALEEVYGAYREPIFF